MKKKTLAMLLIVILSFSLLAGCGSGDNQKEAEDPAANYPNKPVELLIPFAAGGPGDIMSRSFAEIASSHLGQQIVPVNMPGGSGAVAINHMMSKPADGYIFMNHASILPYVMTSGEADIPADALRPLATLTASAQVISVKADSPWKTLDDFIKYCKENPGKISCAGTAINGTGHIFYMVFAEEAGIECQYIPYESGADDMLSLLAGDTQAAFTSVSPVEPYIQSGEMRMLAVTGSERLEKYPDVPTFVECGYKEPEADMLWRGLFINKNTPEPIVQKLLDVIDKTMKDPKWADFLDKFADDSYYHTGAEFEAIFNTYLERGNKIFGKK